MPAERRVQFAYSDLQPKMHEEHGRRRKAAKIIQVLTHFLGQADLDGRTVLDLGCSTGFITDELHRARADVTGVDIDEPGLEQARRRFGGRVPFRRADGADLPFADRSIDAVVFNQIYEHVVDPDAVLAEIRRVLRPDGVVYLGLGNRLGIMEPHHRLPFLSWLPAGAADRYVAATGRADAYHERFRTRAGLRRLCRGLRVWDYTYTVLAEPARFGADDMVPARLASAPPLLWTALTPIIPTFVWVGTPGTDAPRGARCRVAPRPVDGIPPAPAPIRPV
ncbi:MAG TPA: methyltransferase domain-containing protein [Mycobacteriales bacterium]|nr:methyltransferase domain-containing protein [Mycobacteriales bacterium]